MAHVDQTVVLKSIYEMTKIVEDFSDTYFSSSAIASRSDYNLQLQRAIVRKALDNLADKGLVLRIRTLSTSLRTPLTSSPEEASRSFRANLSREADILAYIDAVDRTPVQTPV